MVLATVWRMDCRDAEWEEKTHREAVTGVQDLGDGDVG